MTDTTSTTPTQFFSVKYARHEDVPALAKISHASFEVDRHTEMKGHGKKPYNMEEVALDYIPPYIDHERLVVLKAVDNETGDIVGWCAWGFRGFPKGELPVVKGDVRPEPRPKPVQKEEEKTEEAEEPKQAEEESLEDDPVKRLEAMTSKDMDDWCERFMPEGTKCMFVASLSVSPEYQGRGVGKALLKWGLDTADAHKVFIWVHSSEGAWPVYAKAGFEVVGTLDVDLDAWAPAPPPEKDTIWGHYIFRYMVYPANHPLKSTWAKKE